MKLKYFQIQTCLESWELVSPRALHGVSYNYVIKSHRVYIIKCDVKYPVMKQKIAWDHVMECHVLKYHTITLCLRNPNELKSDGYVKNSNVGTFVIKSFQTEDLFWTLVYEQSSFSRLFKTSTKHILGGVAGGVEVKQLKTDLATNIKHETRFQIDHRVFSIKYKVAKMVVCIEGLYRCRKSYTQYGSIWWSLDQDIG